MVRQARNDHPLDVLRPFALIWAVFFATGFWGYFALTPLR